MYTQNPQGAADLLIVKLLDGYRDVDLQTLADIDKPDRLLLGHPVFNSADVISRSVKAFGLYRIFHVGRGIRC